MPKKNIIHRSWKRLNVEGQPFSKILKRGFTLIELLVVIAIISLLVSILLPSLNKAKDLAKTVVCQTNQKSIATALTMYINDYEGVLPPWGHKDYIKSRQWTRLLMPYAGDTGNDLGDEFLRCPETLEIESHSYGVNYCKVFGIEENPYYPRSMNLANVRVGTILTAETWAMDMFYNPRIWKFNLQLADYDMPDSFNTHKFNFFNPRHDDNTINPCSFADGHVESVYIVDFLTNKGKMWGI